jgi:hypothetical protein
MRRFKGGNRLLPRDRWKCVEKLIEAVSTFKIVEEIPQRHTRANENRSAAQDLWVAVDNLYSGTHTSAPIPDVNISQAGSPANTAATGPESNEQKRREKDE